MGNNHTQKYINAPYSEDPIFPTNLIWYNILFEYQSSIQTVCQQKDESGLYDFDMKQQNPQKTIILKFEGSIVRTGSEIEYCYEKLEKRLTDESVYLSKVFQTNSGIFFKGFGTDGSKETDLWLVLNKYDRKISQNPIQIGDQFKLGRIRLRVNEMSIIEQQNIIQHIDYANLQKYASISNFKTVQACRVCLSIEEGSPLIRPCNCNGSVAFIHVNCLREWFKLKVQAQKSDLTKKGGVTYYAWKNLECEICKKQYQYNFEVDGIQFQLFDMVKPNGPYVLFESLTKDRNSLKGLYLVDMTFTNIIKMGRGQDIDMRLLDISVSRVHTTMHYNKGQFYIYDAGSKFGTVGLVRDQINLCMHPFQNAQFLIAQTLITFDIKLKKENMMQCFRKSSKAETSVGLSINEQQKLSQSFQFQYDDDNSRGDDSPLQKQNSSLDQIEEMSLQKIEQKIEDIQEITKSQQIIRNQHFSQKKSSLIDINQPFFVRQQSLRHSSVQFLVKEQDEDGASSPLASQLVDSGISTIDLMGSPENPNKKRASNVTINNLDIFEVEPQFKESEAPHIQTIFRQVSYKPPNVNPEADDVYRSKSSVDKTDDDQCDQYLKYSREMLDEIQQFNESLNK